MNQALVLCFLVPEPGKDHCKIEMKEIKGSLDNVFYRDEHRSNSIVKCSKAVDSTFAALALSIIMGQIETKN
ncbi:hypothetical protein CCR75_001167 [Bremia lactucae]|uniref:Uncharacterized protein n=1 Tax=Bremia lactucae TaxID=4779 RepID=A0A976IGC6_BRELC|nr:hypothetical protein CCR75_001167 [Bremia lactucae]